MFPIIKKQVTPEQKNFDELNRKIVELESQLKLKDQKIVELETQIKSKDKKIKALEVKFEQERRRSSEQEKKETPAKIEERKPVIIEAEPEEKVQENSRYNHRKNRFNFEE